MTRDAGERGYALIAVVAALAAFALLAFDSLATTRGGVAMAQARSDRARLDAACDAGIALATHGLAIQDRRQRWAIDGRLRTMRYNGVRLDIRIEDERGKISLNTIDDERARALFSTAGARGVQLETLIDSFADWRDDDEARRPHGAELPDYDGTGIAPRNGDFVTVAELRHIKGMTEGLFQRIRPAVTVFFGESGGFDPATAHPFALAVMSGLSLTSPQVTARSRARASQQTHQDQAGSDDRAARAFTVHVMATAQNGARAQRSAVVEFTDAALRHAAIRELL